MHFSNDFFILRYQSAIENNPKYLSQLIELAFEQFKITARLYKQFIEYASRVNQSSIRYQHGIIWTFMQSILVQLLEEYLDTRQANQNLATTQEMLDKLDINSFFARKRLLNLGFGSSDAPASGAVGNSAGSANAGAVSANTNLFGGNEDQSNHRRLFTFKGISKIHVIILHNFFELSV
jgi:hypothetical protein